MFQGKSICVVVPCFNEQRNIAQVIETLPEFIDNVIIVDDASTDLTLERIQKIQAGNNKVQIIKHDFNMGVGASISSGYKAAVKLESDVTLVMAGDGQMDPQFIESLIKPLIEGKYDFSKTNRLFDSTSKITIPKIRYLGNFLLSFATKISTGYWHISDAQSGYTAINKKALHSLNWDSMYKRFGQPNDLLAMLNAFDFKVLDVFTPPRYNVGEVSKLRIRKAAHTIPRILIKRFFWRLWVKYIVRSTHPLVLLYFIGITLIIIDFFLFLHIINYLLIHRTAPLISTIAFLFAFTLGLQSISYAMWMDFDYNRNLHN